MLFDNVERLLLNALKNKNFTAANILVGCGNEILFKNSYGKCSVEVDAKSSNLETKFDVASLTKPLVVGMLTLRALEKGLICLDDTLSNFVDAPADKQNITILQILTHTAGFSPGYHLWNEVKHPKDSLNALLRVPLAYTPGTSVLYCCAGYLLLAMVLEKIYNLELKTLSEQEVFIPLGMRNTHYLSSGSNIASTEMQNNGRCLTGIVHDENARFLNGVAGNAGVFSTVEDISLFVKMLYHRGKIADGTAYLSSRTVDVAMQNYTHSLGDGRGLSLYLPFQNRGYIGDLFPKETVGHTGFTGTSFTLDPTTGIYLVFLCNRVCPSRDNLSIHRLRRLLHNTVYSSIIH